MTLTRKYWHLSGKEAELTYKNSLKYNRHPVSRMPIFLLVIIANYIILIYRSLDNWCCFDQAGMISL